MILDPAQWDRFVRGEAYVDSSACWQAAVFAARNEAELSGRGCVPLSAGVAGFGVTVRTTGSEPRHATASAEAVIEPRCTFTASAPPTEPTPDPTPSDGAEEEAPIEGLVCDGESWDIDPENPSLPDAVDLFAVQLSE
ncbi:hypothetical protein ACFVZH_09575 [Streptomyces sp. NPDC059534]|uniref:hypothetical protein n=1 Tax=Streptomyces sp. NPDC059534 TaxID=3346859 RepID=UPI00367D07C1